jgi:hypothetical protein
VAEDTSLVVAVCGAVNEDDPVGRTIAKVQAGLQETVLHLKQLAPTDCGGVSALRLTSALTSVVQQTGMSQSESGLSLCFMSTTRTEVSSLDDRSASRQFLGQYSWCQLRLIVVCKGFARLVSVSSKKLRRLDSCESCVEDALHNATCALVCSAVWELAYMTRNSQWVDPVVCSIRKSFTLRAVLSSHVLLIPVKYSEMRS